jgi:hypothetical protein
VPTGIGRREGGTPRACFSDGVLVW